MDEIGKYEVLEKIGVSGSASCTRRTTRHQALVAIKTCTADDGHPAALLQEAEIATAACNTAW